MKNIHWFDANRSLSTEVSEFMRCYIWAAELKLRYDKKLEAARNRLELLESPDMVWITPAQKEETLVSARATIQKLEDELSEELKKQATFEPSEAGKALRRGLRKNPASGDIEIVAFFRAYGLDVEGTELINEILTAAGEKIDKRTIVNSGAKVVTAFDATRCYKMVYAKAYEHMVCVGTIKPQQIPEMMMDKYDSARAKARKAAKKGAKA